MIENCEYDVMVIRKWLHANVNKQRTSLTDVDVTLSRGAFYITYHFNDLHRKCRQPEMLVAS